MRSTWLRSLLMALPVLTGCLSHTRKVQQAKLPPVVLSAPAEKLVDSINEQFESIHSLSATVEFHATEGGALKGREKTYTSFSGYILLRKPESIRVLGLLPVLHTQAFDMASDGNTFKLFIRLKNKAIVGPNKISKKSSNPLENLRPSVFFDSLLIDPIGKDDLCTLTSDNKTVVVGKSKELMLQPDYNLTILRRKDQSNVLTPERVIHFSRIDLHPYQEDIYDNDGAIETTAVYGPMQTFGKIQFPGVITIKRPLDQYQIQITFQKVIVNLELKDNQFELKIPEGTQIQNLN
jgi:hypothetical protein